MKILVAIASYGTNNDQYLAQLVAEYKSMPHDVHIVVLSNVQKEVPGGVELIVGLPSKNPWSLPFAHRPVFIDRSEDYDLYVYSEDDTLITQAHVQAFIDACDDLRDDELAGFIRSEVGSDGTRYYSTIHRHYHWDPRSVCIRGDDTYAYFTNEHGACYMLTRRQLALAIASGGFVAAPHEGKYDMLVSAATDPYTQCGFRKLVCISRLHEFTCKHLTNKYVGRTGLKSSFVDIQVTALLDIARAVDAIPSPVRVEALPNSTDWAKSYYESVRNDIAEMLPSGIRRVLSLGCGWGATEESIASKGVAVTAVPLDVVIGRVAEARGIRVIFESLENAVTQLAEERFDAVIVSGILHLVSDPEGLLRSYARLLSPGGRIVLSYPNFSHASAQVRRFRRRDSFGRSSSSGGRDLQLTSQRIVRRWLEGAGFEVDKVVDLFQGRWTRFNELTMGLVPWLWSGECITRAKYSG